MSTHFGLDVGRAAVKLVRVDAGRGGETRSVRAAWRDVDLALEGVARREALTRAISACADELGAKPGTSIAVAVPRAEAVVRRLAVPPVSAPELAQLIRFQASKDVPFEIAEAVLAHGVLGPAPGGGQEVLYAAVRSGVLEELRRTVHAAGFVAGALEVSTQAAARAARAIVPESRDALLLVIGARATDIVVLENGRLALSRSASVGYHRDEGESGEELAWVEKLAQEIQRSLRSGREGAGLAPKELLLAGGGAGRPGVAQTLGAHLGLPPRVLTALPGDQDGARGAACLVARGLAEPRQQDGVPALDLAGTAERSAARRSRDLLAAGLGLAALLLVAGGVLVSRELSARKSRSTKLEQALARLKPEEKRLRNLQRELTVADRWLARKTQALDLLLAVSTSLPKKDAYVTRFQWTEGRPLTLVGRARDPQAVTSFTRKLEATDAVEHAIPDRIVRPDKPAEAETKGVEFWVVARLKSDAPAEKAPR